LAAGLAGLGFAAAAGFGALADFGAAAAGAAVGLAGADTVAVVGAASSGFLRPSFCNIFENKPMVNPFFELEWIQCRDAQQQFTQPYLVIITQVRACF
jgi:hypothetical protein